MMKPTIDLSANLGLSFCSNLVLVCEPEHTDGPCQKWKIIESGTGLTRLECPKVVGGKITAVSVGKRNDSDSFSLCVVREGGAPKPFTTTLIEYFVIDCYPSILCQKIRHEIGNVRHVRLVNDRLFFFRVNELVSFPRPTEMPGWQDEKVESYLELPNCLRWQGQGDLVKLFFNAPTVLIYPLAEGGYRLMAVINKDKVLSTYLQKSNPVWYSHNVASCFLGYRYRQGITIGPVGDLTLHKTTALLYGAKENDFILLASDQAYLYIVDTREKGSIRFARIKINTAIKKANVHLMSNNPFHDEKCACVFSDINNHLFVYQVGLRNNGSQSYDPVEKMSLSIFSETVFVNSTIDLALQSVKVIYVDNRNALSSVVVGL